MCYDSPCQIAWIKAGSQATYFPFHWETLQPFFYMITLNGTIWMQRVTNLYKLQPMWLCDSDMGFRHKSFAMRFLGMIMKTPCTINSIYSMFNQIMDCKKCFTKCCMGINFKVVKTESLIVWAHATSLLATQCWNLSIELNKILPLSKRFTMVLFFSISSFVSILVPPSSSFWFTTTFYLYFYYCDSLSTSSLFIPPLIFPNIVFPSVSTNFLHSRNNLK
jgi:hypothetical protein